MDVRNLKERAAMARRRAETARTTQERQHFEGMASYWEELLEEDETGGSPSLAVSPPKNDLPAKG
jgi:hypothetical protein